MHSPFSQEPKFGLYINIECHFPLTFNLSPVPQEAALEVMDLIRHWVLEDDSGLGRPQLAGSTPTNTLAVPMMVLCLTDQLETSLPDLDVAHKTAYRKMARWAIDRVLAHSQVPMKMRETSL